MTPTFPGLLRQHNISYLSAFKTSATSEYFFEIIERKQIDLLPELFFFAKVAKAPIIFLWGGTNCLFAFDHFPGIIVRNRLVGHTEPMHVGDHTILHVNSGEVTTTFALKLSQNYHIETLVPWVGLPGTMGGATVGNAGCFGLEMKDIFMEAEVLDLETGDTKKMDLEAMQYGYRESILKNNPRYFLISTTIDCASIAKSADYKHYTPTELQVIRKLKQPPWLSCGSFFKNPSGDSAGRLLDVAGLKGFRIGGVKISEHHANFFINDQKGSWQDVIALRDHAIQVVKEKTGITLVEEVRIISF